MILNMDSAARAHDEAPSYTGETINADVGWELERLREAGIARVIVVDLTRPELRVPVARVVIPGLEALSTAPGYVPGLRARARIANTADSPVPATS
jgi:ribosomal protein S12 methylthiotransferase accessory factor